MARTTIELPDFFDYTTEYTVVVSDINAANHLGADRIMPIIIETQMRFFGALGYLNSHTIEGAGYIMVDSETLYKSESSYGDNLVIEVAARNFGRNNFELVYRITNKASGMEVARVKTGMLFFDYESRKPMAVPEKFEKLFLLNNG